MRAPRRRLPRKADPHTNVFILWSGLNLLYLASLDAHVHQRDPWDFAVEVEELIGQGVSRTTLRELLAQGLVEHAIEETRPGSARRSFRPIQNLTIPKRACFILTSAGAELAEQARKEQARPSGTRTKEAKPVGADGPADHPHWDGVSLLRWGDEVLKQFRRAAIMQTRILDEFEAKGWPRRIDNPLPRLSGVNRKQHLRETIKNLNRGLTRKRIVFHADGSGLGICWMPVLGV